MNICPICNGLVNYDLYCRFCGSKMEILDRIEDYEDSYSPYLSYNITDMNDGDPSNICSHACRCKNCNINGVAKINCIQIL